MINNKIFKLVSLCFIFTWISSFITAQNIVNDDQLSGVVYNKETTVDFILHTNGYFALGLNKGKMKTYYKTNYYHFEIGALKHSKEARNNNMRNQIIFGEYRGSSYIFAKRNSAFMLRAATGQKRYFSEKQKENGLAVGISYMGGVTLAVLKPYYLNILSSNDDNEIEFIQTEYTDEYADEFLTVNSSSSIILGHSGFGYGWDKLSFVPAAHAKFSIHLDWGAFDEVVKALDFGFMVDVFYKKLPLMVFEETDYNRYVFMNVFVSLQFGKRKN